jgi:hypothetical protein
LYKEIAFITPHSKQVLLVAGSHLGFAKNISGFARDKKRWQKIKFLAK